LANDGGGLRTRPRRGEDDAVTTTTATAASAVTSAGPSRRRRFSGGIRGHQNRTGWGFFVPMLVFIGLFVLAPILLALWVSLSDWTGQGSPLSSNVGFVGWDNYAQLFGDSGLVRRDFMTSLRNNFYYVLLVVPCQTVLALGLALMLNQKLRARGFFRSAFYFPSVTSSVAISLVFIFLFTGGGAVNAALGFFGITGPVWFADPRGVLHIIGGAIGIWDPAAPPAALTENSLLGLTWWEWLSGPSVAMMAIIALVVWTTAGTFMLMFLAALQSLSTEVTEAAQIDGASRWQRLRFVTIPMLKPTMFLVITLGLIGTWQVFDQVYIMSQGNPAKTTLTPAYLSYQYAFITHKWGIAAAMAFVLFAIILVFTGVQRFIMRDKDSIAERRVTKRVARLRASGGTR
jgi:multiple sugar transport system permease protein